MVPPDSRAADAIARAVVEGTVPVVTAWPTDESAGHQAVGVWRDAENAVAVLATRTW
ncbi:hypothetical protein [Actinokineospora cianjurensis]|uniref:Uncharacterized protein n=1 Tax=Actinokineospora cianjurensis TaxID=585224 RepID=A0A421AYW0_9PSEU|nr:hypothetical protein [Actinokineospora cianjurensis]RLK55010.1 hypothetical protein CLV68_5402 [Actinokineospora cianjurensis]